MNQGAIQGRGLRQRASSSEPAQTGQGPDLRRGAAWMARTGASTMESEQS